MEQQSEVTRNDLLIDDTVREVLWRFDVDHAFPATYHGGDDDKATRKDSWLSRVWQRFATFLGVRSHVPQKVRGEQGDGAAGGNTAFPGS